tara:strand:+ start:8225 stop:8635 length:411 start_codon:yes stop_codon:yes gene_type:complete
LKFKTLSGSEKRVPLSHKYLIDWDSASKSKFQRNVKIFLKDYWLNHVVFEEFPVVGTRLSLDFFNANKYIAIEVQGDQHTKYVPFFHGKYKNNYLQQLKRDHQKQEFCELNNIKLVEIYSSDIIGADLFKSYNIKL